MKFAIIGAGNIGSALAFGLAQSKLVRTEDISISNTHPEKLERIRPSTPSSAPPPTTASASLVPTSWCWP